MSTPFSASIAFRIRLWAGFPILPLTVAGLVLLVLAPGCNEVRQVEGAALFSVRCRYCHGSAGQGEDPRRPFGSIAPDQEGWIAPALNGQGHCYLHTRKQLFSIIRDGSPFPGTTMVGFKDRLSDAEIEALISYVVSLWDRNTREQYEQREAEYERLSRP